MDFEQIILEGFGGREEALKQIKRFINPTQPIMFYRTNDLIHSKRVLWHLEEAISDIIEVYEDFDINFARTLALVHDDMEILTGDIQLHDKENMNLEELEQLEQKELDVIPELIKRYNPIANGYSYEELLLSAKSKDRLEAQFVSFFDKFDGGGEAWHEVCAGNEYFLFPAGGHDGKKGGYVRRLNDFPSKYHSMKEFFNRFPDYLPKPFDFLHVCKSGKPHTRDSLQKDSNYFPYETWKKNVIENEGVENLTTQKEFI